MDRWILHCDCDAFYASVEQFYRPELRGKPVAVCGDPDKRHGIVLAKPQPAKLAGVEKHTAIYYHEDSLTINGGITVTATGEFQGISSSGDIIIQCGRVYTRPVLMREFVLFQEIFPF